MSRYLKVTNGQLVWSDTNRPCYEIGAHCWQAMGRLYTNSSITDNGLPIYERAFSLMQQYGIKVAHIVVGTSGLEGLNNASAGFFINQSVFLARLQAILDSANSHGISLCLLMFLNPVSMAQYSGNATGSSDVANIRAAWTGASTTRTNATSYMTAIVNAFINHPAVAMWECFGELSDSAYSTGSTNWGFGSGADREPGRSDMHTAIEWVASQIRALDPNRAISTGNGAFMTAISPVTSVSTPIGYATQVDADTTSSCDVSSIHPYPFLSLDNRYLNPGRLFGDVKKLIAKPLLLGEFGVNDNWWTGQRSTTSPNFPVEAGAIPWGATESTPALALNRMLAAIIEARVQLSFIWNLDLPYLGVAAAASNGTYHNQDGWPIWYGLNEYKLAAIQTAQIALNGIAAQKRAI